MDAIGLAKTALGGCILRIVEIFKGKKEEMYLYVDQKRDCGSPGRFAFDVWTNGISHGHP